MSTVTKVGDLNSPEFEAITENVLWLTQEETYITTSWLPETEGEPANTAVWFSDEYGLPVDWNDVTDEKLVKVTGDSPAHEAALEAFGFTVQEDSNV
jgi:hypothetical protein